MIRTFRTLGLVQSKRARFQVLGNQYHSYPDPSEKPIVSFTKSSTAKRIDKNAADFLKLDVAHKMDKIFPGTPISKGISKATPPETISTVLSNGLTVATQEMPGLMSSFAFLVRTGRFVVNIARCCFQIMSVTALTNIRAVHLTTLEVLNF